MQHISEIIENILVEWAYRVHDGMPNPKNAQHIIELRESMEELNLPNKVIYEVIQNLINEEGGLSDEEKEKAKKMGLVHLGKGAYGKEGGEATHQAVDGKLVTKDTGDDGGESKTKKTKIDSNPFEKDKKDDKFKPAKSPEEKKQQSVEIKKEIVINEKLNKDTKSHIDPKVRIQNIKVQAEIDLDGKEEDKAKESLNHLGEFLENQIKEEGSYSQRNLNLTTSAWVSGRRKNSDLGKNMQTMKERDAVLKHNRENLLELYDDAKPDLVEKGVRGIRHREVSEKELDANYKALPPDFRKALERKGKVAGKNAKNHFLGYIAVNPDTKKEYVTSNRNDPNIKIDENWCFLNKN